MRGLRSAPSADADVTNRAHAARYLDWQFDAGGSLRIHGRLSADDGAAVVEAIEAAAEAPRGVPGRRGGR